MFAAALYLLPHGMLERTTLRRVGGILFAGGCLAGVATALQGVSLLAAAFGGGVTFCGLILSLGVVSRSDISMVGQQGLAMLRRSRARHV